MWSSLSTRRTAILIVLGLRYVDSTSLCEMTCGSSRAIMLTEHSRTATQVCSVVAIELVPRLKILGCACDVPSHAYTYAFALNADWPQFLSGSDDIFRYLLRVVNCFGLRRFMRFNSVIERREWNDDEGQWHVDIRDALTGEIAHDTCHILIGANGLLNSWKYPAEVEGLQSFKGRLLHTARWPDNYGPEQWKNERVAVLGSGASAIQVVPTMQPHVKHMDVFVRTPVWFAQLAGHSGVNRDCKTSCIVAGLANSTC